MVELSYDIIRHNNGFAIVITPRNADAFATRQDAFDAAADCTRKLRFAGYSVMIRVPGSEQRNLGKRQSS